MNVKHAVFVVITLGIIAFAIFTQRPTPQEAALPEASSHQQPPASTGPTDGPVSPGEQSLQYDPDRLYEKSYENDPDIQELARVTNLPARCVIEGLREYEDGIPMSDDCMEARQKNRVPPSDLYEVSLVFERYSIDELKQLAGTEPDAAVLLARRLDDPAEFRRYYEQAIKLLEQREIDSRAVQFELHGRL